MLSSPENISQEAAILPMSMFVMSCPPLPATSDTPVKNSSTDDSKIGGDSSTIISWLVFHIASISCAKDVQIITEVIAANNKTSRLYMNTLTNKNVLRRTAEIVKKQKKKKMEKTKKKVCTRVQTRVILVLKLLCNYRTRVFISITFPG